MTVPPLKPGQEYQAAELYGPDGRRPPRIIMRRSVDGMFYVVTRDLGFDGKQMWSYKTHPAAVKRFKKLCGETT